MKACLVGVVIVLLMATSAIAQTNTSCPAGTTAYLIQTGDTPWGKEGPAWERLLGPNSWLERRVTRRSADNVSVLWYPGETLCLPAGIAPSDVVKSVAPPVAKPVDPPIVKKSAPVAPAVVASFPWWKWLLWFVLAAAIVLAAVWAVRWLLLQLEAAQERERQRVEQVVEANRRLEEQRRQREAAATREHELTRNPVTSGTPFVPGGISATEPERLRNFFEQQAVAGYATRTPGVDRATIHVEQIGPIEHGTISGEGEVGYLGGQWRQRRILTPIPAYQGRFRFPDGTEEVLQTLQGCMNPVRSGVGEVMRGFTFVPGCVVVLAPELVAPTPAPVAPTVEPIVPAPVAEVEHKDGVVKLEVRRATDGQPAMIRMTGVDETGDNTCELWPGIVILRFTPRN